MSVVMKFGGTSVADEDGDSRASTAIVRRQIERQPARRRGRRSSSSPRCRR